ncbi:ABC transporter ATP-binding protein [Saccharothrix deserti]|uniref:ABC transporter ATP-binding protein n=1 Tax=Saccharothrix deserti TaxID=2593674 RepID=UPI00192E5842|nr:ABC transporter ATP-binding protein [Saccharothrix deserti]
MARLRQREEWAFFAELPRVDRLLATTWWSLLVLRGVLPALFAVITGHLVGALRSGEGVPLALAALGTLFVLMQVVAPLQATVGTSLGERLTAALNDHLLAASVEPGGLAQLEDPRLVDDLTAGRDAELGLSGPPMPLALGFTAASLIDFFAGLALTAVLAFYHWWAALLVGVAWMSTHLLLRTATVWDRETGEVLAAQRHAEYSYRLAMDSPAAKEVRVFGLSEWLVDRFAAARRRLVDARWRAARLSPGRVGLTVAIVVIANALVLLALARDAASGALSMSAAISYVQAAVGASALALGGMNWALPHAAHTVALVRGLEPRMREKGRLADGRQAADGMPAREIRFRDVRFSYAPDAPPVLDGFDLTVPAGSSLAVVGVNGAGKTTLAKLLCRLYDPTAGRIEVDGVDLRELSLDHWRRRLSVIFQDYVRYDLSLRDNVAPLGGSDAEILAALRDADASGVADLDTVLAPGYVGGVDLSGGQWQRVALARVLHGVRHGAGVVILDEPTAQLDIRGEARVFQRLLEATRGCTTILISHRFATVRLVDRICVLEHGRVVELGSHEELMAAGGRYRTMFDLQASRFEEEEPDESVLA